MDKKTEDIDKSSEIAASPERTDDALQSDSNLKSGTDADPSEKLSQPLDPIEDNEEDLLLCMNSENEPFEGCSDVKESAKKSAVGEKSEKYFSDIESSDNSQEYEPKSVEKDVAVVEKEVVVLEKEKKEVEVESVEKPDELEKTIELELEPVESDEEEFDENLLVKKTEDTQITKDDDTAKETGPIKVLIEDDAAKEKKEAPTLEENKVTVCIDVGEKDKEDKEKPETLDIPEQKGNSSESDPKQAADNFEEKEKESDDCSPELGTGKENKTQVPDVIDLEAGEIQKDDTNETMELKEDDDESSNPFIKETVGEIGEEIEKTAVKDTEVKVLDTEVNVVDPEVKVLDTEVKVVDAEVKVLETEAKVLDATETSLEKLKESNDASPPEKVKEDKTEISDGNILQSTENVSKDPPASISEGISSACQPSKEHEFKSHAETRSPEIIGSLIKTSEAIASPVKEPIAKEIEKIAAPVEELISKETEAIASPVEAPISKETEANMEKKAEACDPKASHIELGDAPISDKPESVKPGKAGEDTKEEDKTKTTLDKEIVVSDEDEEATVEAEQGEKISESKEKLKDTQDSDKPDLKEIGKEEDKTVTLSDKEIDHVGDASELNLEAKQIEETAETEKKTKATEELTEEKVLESPPAPEESKDEPEAIETAVEEPAQQPDLSPAEEIPTPPTDEPKATDDKYTPSPTAEDVALEDEGSHLREKLTTKVSELMKTIDTSSLQGLTSDDDESLLVIDTTHKDDNENEDNDVDTETEQTAATASNTDSSSDGSLEIFYQKECSNYDCSHGSKNFYRAPQFTLSYYKVSKKRYKPQFVCEDCYDQALHAYEEMCVCLKQKQPLYGANFKRQDFVEIIDSSDEEDTDNNADNCRDESTFPKESIEFLENELEGIIRNVMQNVDIQNQLSWTKQVLQQSLDRVKDESNYVSDQLQQLQKKADKMHNSLYQCPSIKIRQLTPLDLNSGRSYSPESESTIPAIGDIERPSIQLNETYYAVKNKAIASWVPCKVIEEVDDCTSQTKNLKHFKIKFLKSKYPMLKTLSAKHMAYFDPPRVRLPIGTRVIAYFDASSLSRGKEKMLIPSAFYPGIIAEPLKMSNKFRYLVFYDDGYFQYVSYKDVRLVCHASENVWDDVHHQSRDFIQNYLTQYAVNRPMVQTQKGQCMLVDYNGKWVYARVVDVDCSLVQMMFEGQSRSEWIYRGSTRLGPVYKESNNIAPKTSWNQSRISRRTEPFIRYFNDEDSSSSQPHSQSQQHQSKSGEVRSVAKKSVSRTDPASGSQPVPVVKHLNNSTIFVDDDNKPKGKVVYYTARKNLPPRDFVPHTCGASCPFVITHNLQFYSPLAKPLLSGWERQVFRQKSKKFIVYRGPCGKRLRSMEELHRYLRVTKNELNVDNFDFSSETNCLAEYVIESCIVQKKDISNGEEKMPIPCVNYYDNTMPPDCKYSSRRIPTEGVHLNLDPNFLVGCDCEDDCSDKSKCSCWQLTYAGAKYSMPNVPNEMVGYQFKRLYAHVPTGIYECNSRCKCKANCVNRVVQQSLQSKLQVFKTSNRGWGLRCINDVPRGSFICIYAGHLLTEQKANEGGLDAGDEYFAELDYIEVAEQIKEGYESDVVEADEEEEMYNPDKDDDDDEFIAPGDPHRNKAVNTRLSTRRSTKNSSDAEHDSQERQVISFEPNKSQERPSSATERPTMRRLFGKDEGTYIMDAKVTGNLGRYFNHSCSPNLFVQNVFVDTHDLRFPWVAFFAFSHIRAGTELTWNYNYEVGVVPGKVLYCQCGAPNCRQRLL